MRAIGPGCSLFDYILDDVPRLITPQGDLWALCDDGAGEVADFIFFDPRGVEALFERQAAGMRCFELFRNGGKGHSAGRALHRPADQVFANAERTLALRAVHNKVGHRVSASLYSF